jgi:gamma-glutamyl hercynylcysteine S-oxide synthase
MARDDARARSRAGLPDAATLAEWVADARRRTIELVDDLGDPQLLGKPLAIVNPLLWEIGHVAWFQERWVLRHALGQEPVRGDGDALYDSSAVHHGTRWDLPLPGRAETYRYLHDVRDRVLEALAVGEPSPELAYHVMYGVFHEDMHVEAFTYTRQTLGYPAPVSYRPDQVSEVERGVQGGSWEGDAELPGGIYLLGGDPEEPFVFDNEKWQHPVEVRPFAIARAAVTQGEFRGFVEDEGYQRQGLWSPEGWAWRQREGAEGPAYWRREGDAWLRRHFDRWVPLEPHRPMVHVSWFEADAYCRWAGRRLPTEAEWEAAATGGLLGAKRRYPWGDAVGRPGDGRANLDGIHVGCLEVGALPIGDAACGCRQLLGNVWEWTASPFEPFPGFTPDPYKDYSAPWFGDRKVLRGGAWPTRSRLIRNGYRNYYTPERRDVWAGFRTCRAEERARKPKAA